MDEQPVECIIGHRVQRGKDKYLVKRQGHSKPTWEPIENLFNYMDLVTEYMSKNTKNKKVLDQIIGCGERNGLRYFLVRFKGSTESEIIDWDEAKNYAIQVMEFFGSRLKWKPIEIEVDQTDQNILNQDVTGCTYGSTTIATTSTKPNALTTHDNESLINDIEYAD